MLILLTLFYIKGYTLSLNILYEKQVENTVGETYRIYLDQLVKTINDQIINKNIKIDLKSVLAHNEYSLLPKYDEISKNAGSDYIEERVSAIKDLKENIILAASTTYEKDLDQYGEVGPCKVIYLINLDSKANFDNDLLTNLHYGTLKVLSKIFGHEVPNLLDKKNTTGKEKFLKELEKGNIEEKMAKCEETNEKEKDLKTNIKQTDALVNEFDKIMNILKMKKDETEKLLESESKDNLIEKKIKKEKNKEEIIDKKHKNENEPKKYDIMDFKKETYEKERKADTQRMQETFFREILQELKSLRTDLVNNKGPRPKRYHNMTGERKFEDFKKENVVNLPLNDKQISFQPFNFMTQKRNTNVDELKK